MLPPELWSLSPHDFNERRQKNDLPSLLEFFQQELPDFHEWMSQNNVTMDAFIKAPHTGDWFLGNNMRQFVSYFEEGHEKFIISDVLDPHYSFLETRKDKQTIVFKPYLAWGTERNKRADFIPIDQGKSNPSDAPIYGLWAGTGNDFSRAYLLKRFAVLKLGQIELPNGVDIASRNLDFADLDYLTIIGDFHGSYATTVSFSSCRNLSLTKGMLHHATFTRCVLFQLRCSDFRMHDFVFKDSEVDNPEIRNCSINGLSFENSRVTSPILERNEIERFEYNPGRSWLGYTGEADVCRRFRTAFQNIGKRAEASKYYYRERCLERKGLWSPYGQHLSEFPRKKFNGRLSGLIRYWKEGHFDNRKSLELFLDMIAFYFKVWLTPKYLMKASRYKAQYFTSLFEYFVWGYGEKPSRVVIVAVFVIGFFSSIYYLHGPTTSNVLDSVYFSVVTFTTLGYGDIHPTDAYMKIACGFEALIGAVSVGLLIGGFANKSRY